VHRPGRSREHDPGRGAAFDLGKLRRAGQHNRENILLPDTARDQLRILRAKVQDDNGLIWQEIVRGWGFHEGVSQIWAESVKHSPESGCETTSQGKGGERRSGSTPRGRWWSAPEEERAGPAARGRAALPAKWRCTRIPLAAPCRASRRRRNRPG